MTELAQSLRDRFASLGNGPLLPLRQAAFARFEQLGLPTLQDEEWKYTSLAPLAQLRFEPAAPGALPDPGRFSLAGTGVQIVFVDGKHRPDLSSGKASPSGIFAGSLSAALADRPELVRRELSRHADHDREALVALNTAFLQDGAFIHLPEGAVVPEPIHLLFLTTHSGKTTASHPRNLFVAGRGSQATIVETWAGPGGQAYLTNAVTEAVLGDGAHLDHYKVQEEGPRAIHLALLQVEQGRDSRLRSSSIALGAALARNEVRARFASEGGECTLNGLYMAGAKQHLDNRTVVDHQSARCTSRELYKGVLSDRSRGVFSGRVLVRKDAQKTDASQTNKNLLLSDEAWVDTKPQLEILADDVKCAHGAAVGQLDENALFYLRSRGIPQEAARSLLTWAFASEMVELIPLRPLQARVRQLVASRLPAFDGWKEVA
ncbi:MAG TPA: Fe-S cluster assembly protein SufD [Myxococcales bacterium]|nr:Fe-S cluster assembly protein SufD [Myxococcales bacterium]